MSSLLSSVVNHFLVRHGFKSATARAHTPPARKRRKLEDTRRKSASLPVIPSGSLEHDLSSRFTFGREATVPLPEKRHDSGTSTPIVVPEVGTNTLLRQCACSLVAERRPRRRDQMDGSPDWRNVLCRRSDGQLIPCPSQTRGRRRRPWL